MPVQQNILDMGFKNIRDNGKIIGFQVAVKDGYYRGIYLPIIDSFEVTVDGQTFAGDQVQCKFRNNIYTQKDLQNHPNERWQWGEPCTLFVAKSGGLEPGWHNVKIVIKERISYMPMIPTVQTFQAKLALVV
jgi:hypothetical protein